MALLLTPKYRVATLPMMENWIQCMALQHEHSTNIANISQRLLYSRNCPATVGTTAFIVASAALSFSGLNQYRSKS
jgi:hypothetical protein